MHYRQHYSDVGRNKTRLHVFSKHVLFLVYTCNINREKLKRSNITRKKLGTLLLLNVHTHAHANFVFVSVPYQNAPKSITRAERTRQEKFYDI